MRLVNGTTPKEGRVEVCYDGEYRALCSSFWDELDATVLCEQLGYSVGGMFVRTYNELISIIILKCKISMHYTYVLSLILLAGLLETSTVLHSRIDSGADLITADSVCLIPLQFSQL